MKKRKPPRDTNFNPEDRKRNLQFKKKKQRSMERDFNPKRLNDLSDWEDLNEDSFK